MNYYAGKLYYIIITIVIIEIIIIIAVVVTIMSGNRLSISHLQTHFGAFLICNRGLLKPLWQKMNEQFSPFCPNLFIFIKQVHFHLYIVSICLPNCFQGCLLPRDLFYV